jgi:hypothetical protein
MGNTSWTTADDLTLKMAVGPTSVWRVKSDHTISKSLLGSKSWSTVSGVTAIDVGVGSDGSVFYIDNTDRGNGKGNSIF